MGEGAGGRPAALQMGAGRHFLGHVAASPRSALQMGRKLWGEKGLGARSSGGVGLTGVRGEKGLWARVSNRSSRSETGAAALFIVYKLIGDALSKNASLLMHTSKETHIQKRVSPLIYVKGDARLV
jgi:hypothetical protein